MAANRRFSMIDAATEVSPLITPSNRPWPQDDDTEALLPSHTTIDKRLSNAGNAGERVPYQDYTAINWLQDLVKDGERRGQLDSVARGGLRGRASALLDAIHGWIAAAIIGALTAMVAYAVDIGVETVADWKEGYCTAKPWLARRACCELGDECKYWKTWTASFGSSYVIYAGLALVFGSIAGGLTKTTKTILPSLDFGLDGDDEGSQSDNQSQSAQPAMDQTMYMAAGSGIPEIKTILSGLVIPNFLNFKVLVVKALGSIFAVATGMCVGKEGPFVHISACVGYLVTMCIPKYAVSQRKLREMLSVACSAGMSVAFGAPIGGVLFSYEEISTYFPRQVLWRSCLCSLVASAVLKELNPSGTGKLVLFDNRYDVEYGFFHYVGFVFLGVCGGLFGGIFCQSHFKWTNTFRQLGFIKSSPVLEVSIVALITALVQYPNLLIRDTGDIVMEHLLVDCNSMPNDWICQQEARVDGKGSYYAWLISGTFTKLLLTIVTFGCKVPSGIIIPAMDAGALFGRLVGQVVPGISPGVFAMVGSAAFLAGVSRTTVSLAVIMFELTGEVNFIPPTMIAIFTAKWVADGINAEGVYDLSEHIQGHPFMNSEKALSKVTEVRKSEGSATVDLLVPPANVMADIIVSTGSNYKIHAFTLRQKLARLRARGLMDAGLIIVNARGICRGYIPGPELEHAMKLIDQSGGWEDMEVDLTDGVLFGHIDRNPISIPAKAPLECAVEIFGKLGVTYLIVIEQDTAKVVGIVMKKRLMSFFARRK